MTSYLVRAYTAAGTLGKGPVWQHSSHSVIRDMTSWAACLPFCYLRMHTGNTVRNVFTSIIMSGILTPFPSFMAMNINTRHIAQPTPVSLFAGL